MNHCQSLRLCIWCMMERLRIFLRGKKKQLFKTCCPNRWIERKICDLRDLLISLLASSACARNEWPWRMSYGIQLKCLRQDATCLAFFSLPRILCGILCSYAFRINVHHFRYLCKYFVNVMTSSCWNLLISKRNAFPFLSHLIPWCFPFSLTNRLQSKILWIFWLCVVSITTKLYFLYVIKCCPIIKF